MYDIMNKEEIRWLFKCTSINILLLILQLSQGPPSAREYKMRYHVGKAIS